MSNALPREKKQLLVKLAVVGVFLAAATVMVLRGVDIRALIDQGLDVLRGAGPWTFFLAMALVPAAGIPMSLFTLTAAPAFAEELGLGTVVAMGLLAVAVNIAVTYWLSAKALRPLFARLLAWLGYKIPTVATGDMTDLIVIVRVTPGLPFFAQSYLLGLANAPFGKYMMISCLISGVLNAAFIVFGDALLHGKGKMGVIIFMAIIFLTALTHMLRRHYGRKQAKQ